MANRKLPVSVLGRSESGTLTITKKQSGEWVARLAYFDAIMTRQTFEAEGDSYIKAIYNLEAALNADA